jgi:peptidyl-prolyl cis-trans isomerase SurA
MAYPGNDTLFVIQNRLFHTGNFIKYLDSPENNLKTRFDGQYLLDKAFTSFKNEKMVEFERERLPRKYPEYKYLVKEYHDGILLFEIMDRKVWAKASEDSSGLRRYYENHKNNYMWGERFRGKIYLCDNEKVLNRVKKLKKGGWFRKSHSDPEILNKINKDEKKLHIKEGLFHKGDNPIIDHYAWDMETENKIKNKQPYLVEGEIVPPEPKKLEETRGAVLADYQKYLEKQWIKELNNKYEVNINEKVLNEIRNN